jgi:magnesium transporter
MRRLIKRRSVKAGLPPGTVVHIADVAGETTNVTVTCYDEHDVREETIAVDRECPAIAADRGVTWVHVAGLGRVDALEQLGECFKLHPLVIEDIANTDQRPKTEDFGSYVYVVAKMTSYDRQSHELLAEQISLVIGPNFVLSFQESQDDLFGAVRERIRSGKGRIRTMGADYLAYAILDAVVDGYFAAIERLGDRVEAVEEDLTDEPTPRTLHEIHRLKREMIYLTKAIWPLRDAISALQREETKLISPGTGVFLRDCYDHTVHVIDTVTAFRDMLSGMLDLYLSTVSNKMNAIMKVLTIIATLFIPLTFIAGIYGMNFKFMPELKWPWGYPAVLVVMAGLSLAMLIYFKRKDWI